MDELTEGEDLPYYESYSGVEVHRMMLADRARTEAYRDGIEAVVKPGMTVLDVGAGTGILSLFAARAGARKVYAAERSEILDAAEELVRANGYENVIECIDGVAERVDLPEQVDVIVSEWMGLFALTEAMFESVMAAAKKHLKPGGVLIPSGIRLCLTPIQEDRLYRERGLGFWTDDLYGFDFTPMRNVEIADLDSNTVKGGEAIALGAPRTLVEIDCALDPAEKYWFDSAVEFVFDRPGRWHGFLGHFEAELAPGVVLSTAHDQPLTHWRQSWFPISEREVQAGDRVRLRMKARPEPSGEDRRRPIYYTEGEWERGGEVLEILHYCHHGTYE